MSLPEEIAELAQERFEARLADRFKALEQEVPALQNRYSLMGLGRSSAVSQAFFRLAAQEARAMALLAWADLVFVIRNVGLQYYQGVEGDLMTFIEGLLRANMDPVAALYSKQTRVAGYPGPDLEPEILIALRQARAEAAIFSAALKRETLHIHNANSSRQEFNFYSPVGVVISAENINATMQLLIENRPMLVDSLRKARELIEQSSVVGWEETVDTLQQVEEEVEKGRPNPITVVGLLQGITSGIQTIAAMRPAYEALRTAAALLGLPLP